MKILVAEDEAASRELLKEALSRFGYEVLAVQDGALAWEALQRREASLALLDWMMPKLDGLEVCRRLRQQAGAGYVYTILVTGRSQREDLLSALESGADDFIAKPYHLGEL